MSYLKFGKSNLPVGLKDSTQKILHFSFTDIAFKDLYANHTVIRAARANACGRFPIIHGQSNSLNC